jgi:hypothetical protein
VLEEAPPCEPGDRGSGPGSCGDLAGRWAERVLDGRVEATAAEATTVGRAARLGGLETRADWSTAFTSDVTTLKPRPESLRFQDAVETQELRCGSRLRVLSFVYEEAGRPIHMDVAATETVYREQPEMLLHILNSIRVSKP